MEERYKITPQELSYQVTRLIKVTLEEIFSVDFANDPCADEIVENILTKSEVALSERNKEELIEFLNELLN